MTFQQKLINDLAWEADRLTKRNSQLQAELEQHVTELVQLRSEKVRLETIVGLCCHDDAEGYKTSLHKVEGKLANLKRDNEDMYANNSKLHQQVDDIKKQLTVAERRNDGLKASQDKFKEIFDAAMAVAYSHARGRYNLVAADKLAKLFHVSRAELAKCPECQAVGEKTASATCRNIWHNSDSERHMVFGPEMGVKEETG